MAYWFYFLIFVSLSHTYIPTEFFFKMQLMSHVRKIDIICLPIYIPTFSTRQSRKYFHCNLWMLHFPGNLIWRFTLNMASPWNKCINLLPFKCINKVTRAGGNAYNIYSFCKLFLFCFVIKIIKTIFHLGKNYIFF